MIYVVLDRSFLKEAISVRLVPVIAWVAVKFGINTTIVVLEIYHFQYNKSGIYPKFHCYTHAIPNYDVIWVEA